MYMYMSTTQSSLSILLNMTLTFEHAKGQQNLTPDLQLEIVWK